MKKILLISILALAGCQHTQPNSPKASTAAVGADLDSLGNSLDKAKGSVDGIRSDLSAADAKVVKIQTLIHAKRPQ
jgi:hypothetical protein